MGMLSAQVFTDYLFATFQYIKEKSLVQKKIKPHHPSHSNTPNIFQNPPSTVKSPLIAWGSYISLFLFTIIGDALPRDSRVNLTIARC